MAAAPRVIPAARPSVAPTARQVLEAFPSAQRREVEMGLAWLAKLGAVDWLD